MEDRVAFEQLHAEAVEILDLVKGETKPEIVDTIQKIRHLIEEMDTALMMGHPLSGKDKHELNTLLNLLA